MAILAQFGETVTAVPGVLPHLPAIGWLLLFDPKHPALAGTAPPLILPTTVALCVPVTSPESEPEKLTAVVALETAVDPIALTICAALAAAGTAPVE